MRLTLPRPPFVGGLLIELSGGGKCSISNNCDVADHHKCEGGFLMERPVQPKRARDLLFDEYPCVCPCHRILAAKQRRRSTSGSGAR